MSCDSNKTYKMYHLLCASAYQDITDMEVHDMVRNRKLEHLNN